MKKYALDTNVLINAVNADWPSHEAARRILDAAKEGEIHVAVSLQTKHELQEKKDQAWELVQTLSEMNHWSIGSWDEQVGTWKQQTGTWNDAKKNNVIQHELESLAKSGNDIRDRGAFIDALCNGYDAFVTSDKQLVGSGPMKRINERFETKVVTPEQLARHLDV